MTQVEQHLGDARHANAADADEVDGPNLVRQFHALKTLIGPVFRSSGPNNVRPHKMIPLIWETGRP
jgi:hypothetical protein